MDKTTMYREYIYKQASSFNARRNKQYWQLLKRLHGGTDEAVKTLKKTRDFGIYHGTKGNIDDILSSALKPSKRNTAGGVFGKGVYFGDKNFASSYAKKDSLLRLKMPSELKDTKTLYPKVTSAMNHETRINPKNAKGILRKSQTYGPGYFDGQMNADQIKSHFKMDSKVWKDNNMKTLKDYMNKPFIHRNYVGRSGQMMYRREVPGEIIKKASDENMVNKDGKIPAIEKALECPIAREVATMMATSHEYKTPNVDGALAMVKNYKWEKSTEKISNLQGINKPIKKEKVLSIAMGIKDNKGAVKPFIVVNQLHGIRPQSPGKKILLDGHHRMEACQFLGKEEVPVYKGTYTGGAQKSKEELREMDKVAMYKEALFNKRYKIDMAIDDRMGDYLKSNPEAFNVGTDYFNVQNKLVEISKGVDGNMTEDNIINTIKNTKFEDVYNTKVASYKEDIMEKVASRKWKKVIGELSEAGVSKLKNSGILDHAKELAGLNKGTDNILKHYNAKALKTNGPSFAREAVKGIKDEPFTQKILDANNISIKDFRKQTAQAFGVSGGYYTRSSSVPGRSFVNKGSIDKLTKNYNKAVGQNILDVPKDKLNKNYADALLNRHEADEIRHSMNAMKRKRTHLDYKGQKVPMTAVGGGHMSPKVINSESANVAIAPQGAKNFFTNMRNSSTEIDAYKQLYNLDYGKSGVINKKLGRQMENSVARQTKPVYRQIMD